MCEVLFEHVAVGRRPIQVIDAFELFDLLERFARKGWFPLKTVQRHTFDHVTQGHIEVFGERLEDFREQIECRDSEIFIVIPSLLVLHWVAGVPGEQGVAQIGEFFLPKNQ